MAHALTAPFCVLVCACNGQDLLDEIEDGLRGVKRGGRTIERALTDMRTTWTEEVTLTLTLTLTLTDMRTTWTEEVNELSLRRAELIETILVRMPEFL